MPRPNSVTHVITKAREILGLTRPQLAEQIGYSVIYLAKIEAGSRKLPLKIAVRIHEITHVNIDELMAGENGRPRDDNGRTIAKNLRPEANVFSIETVDRWVSSFTDRIETLLDAAVHAEPEKFSAVRYALDLAIDKLENDFKLGHRVTVIRKEYEKAFVEIGMAEASSMIKPEFMETKKQSRKLRYEAHAAKIRSVRQRRMSSRVPSTMM